MVTPTSGIVKKIVFLVYWPITKFEADRWGFKYLSSKDFEVEVYDLSPFLKHKALQKSPVKSQITADYIYKMSSYQEFDRKVMSVASCSVFIDHILGLTEPDLKTEKIYRILRKHNARYFVISAGALPIAINTSGFLTNIFNKIRNAFNNPDKLFNFAVSNLIILIKKFTNIYALPERIFGGNSEILTAYLRRYNINASKLIPIHSLDYDIYLNYIKGAGFKINQSNNTCVFLDEAATHHTDWILLNIKPLTADRYYASMNKLFNAIENITGLKVVIAAHPRSMYEDMPGIFGNREIIKGKTVELVAKSSMVLMHMSTAVSFAVLFNKPIMIIKTSEMVEHSLYSHFLDTLKDSLGVESVNIDNPEEFNQMSLNYDTWPKDKYDDYKFKYIKSKNLVDLTIWEVIALEIIKLNSNQNREPVV